MRSNLFGSAPVGGAAFITGDDLLGLLGIHNVQLPTRVLTTKDIDLIALFIRDFGLDIATLVFPAELEHILSCVNCLDYLVMNLTFYAYYA
jgi:hypothetical protein